jgi:hypothetical protein
MNVICFLFVSLGSSIVQLHYSLGSRRACSEAGFSSQNGDRVRIVLSKSSVLLYAFCGQKDSMQRISIDKCFLFVFGSVCRVKRFHLGGKRFADDEEIETEVRKWLRQQSKDFYAVGFDALVKRYDKCINVAEGYVEKQIILPCQHIICSTFYIYL